jgi:hypothetical protein
MMKTRATAASVRQADSGTDLRVISPVV